MNPPVWGGGTWDGVGPWDGVADVVDHFDWAIPNLSDRACVTDRDEWPELDFHQPKLHEDIERRFVFLHTRAFRGRSYFRVFYRFPEGRHSRSGEQLGICSRRAVGTQS